MSHRVARLLRVISLTLLAVAVPLTGTSGAAIQSFTTPGSHNFTVPAGVTSLNVVAIGGFGGNLGGNGARVAFDLAVTPGESLAIEVAGNGDTGVAGSGGGGAVPLGSFGGGGGGASRITRSGQALAIAAGGGGGGDFSFPGPPGIGGNAGAAGGAAPAAGGTAGGGGGGAGTAVSGGTPGRAGPAPVGCMAGAPGASNAGPGQGGTGGESADPFDFGDGGGGGGGLFGGGGGGSGGYCAATDEGLGGGGGGGGSSLVPTGGRLVVDDTGSPAVTLSWTDVPERPFVSGPPTVTVTVPTEGAVYELGQDVRAAFSCTTNSSATITKCEGSVTNGDRLDTSYAGDDTLVVTAVDSDGLLAVSEVVFAVVDTRTPALSALRLGGRRLDLGAPRAFIGVSFSLNEPGRVLVRLIKGRARRAARVLRLRGRSGRNTFRLRARSGRRTLRPGSYRLVLVATDGVGNRSRPLTRRFSVVD